MTRAALRSQDWSDAFLVILVTECAFAASLHGRSHAHGRELLDALRESEPGLYEIALVAVVGGFPPLNLPGEGFVAIVSQLHRPAQRVASVVRVRCDEGIVDELLASCGRLGRRVRELAEHSIRHGLRLSEHYDAA